MRSGCRRFGGSAHIAHLPRSDDRNYAIMSGVAEIEAHDEVVEWFDELSQNEWERTLVVINRLASLGSKARMPISDLPKSG